MTQLDLFTARHRRDTGMARAAAAQERATPCFADGAASAIYWLARCQPTVHIDDLLAACSLRPAHFNAWGAVWRAAVRAGWIERNGEYRPSADPTKHAHMYPVYNSRIFGGGK